MNHDPQRPITVENLLQLKRAERPPAEFWARFDRDLRAKQLAALVEKRPWWRLAVPRLAAGFSRYHLPLGATAILALTFFTVRDYQPVDRAETVAPAKQAPVVAPAVGVPAPVVAAALVREVAVAPMAANPNEVSPPAEAPAATSDPVDSDRVVPVVAMFDESNSREESPSARSIAANLEAAQAIDPELARRFLSAPHGFEARALPARSPSVEPLAQMATPAEVRRARFVASAMPASFAEVPGNSEKIARRISDDRLYETVSRFGARGDRFSVKF